jgi:hypothetical protein
MRPELCGTSFCLDKWKSVILIAGNIVKIWFADKIWKVVWNFVGYDDEGVSVNNGIWYVTVL